MLNLTIWVALTSAAFAIGETPRATPGPTTPPARSGREVTPSSGVTSVPEVTPKNLVPDLSGTAKRNGDDVAVPGRRSVPEAPSKETKK